LVSGRDSWRALFKNRFVLRGLADLLERGNGHGARRPMMTTTIMISTSVKPLMERVFILCGLCGYFFSPAECERRSSNRLILPAQEPTF